MESTPTIPVQIVIDSAYLEALAKQEIRKAIEGETVGTWWDLKRLEQETTRKRNWLLDNILLNPEYREEMSRISNGCEGGRWLFKADGMRKFLIDNFEKLTKKGRGE